MLSSTTLPWMTISQSLNQVLRRWEQSAASRPFHACRTQRNVRTQRNGIRQCMHDKFGIFRPFHHGITPLFLRGDVNYKRTTCCAATCLASNAVRMDTPLVSAGFNVARTHCSAGHASRRKRTAHGNRSGDVPHAFRCCRRSVSTRRCVLAYRFKLLQNESFAFQTPVFQLGTRGLAARSECGDTLVQRIVFQLFRRRFHFLAGHQREQRPRERPTRTCTYFCLISALADVQRLLMSSRNLSYTCRDCFICCKQR